MGDFVEITIRQSDYVLTLPNHDRPIDETTKSAILVDINRRLEAQLLWYGFGIAPGAPPALKNALPEPYSHPNTPKRPVGLLNGLLST